MNEKIDHETKPKVINLRKGRNAEGIEYTLGVGGPPGRKARRGWRGWFLMGDEGVTRCSGVISW